jgi:hypothetical protein
MVSKKKTGAVMAGLLVATVAALGTAAALNIIDGPTQVLSVFESDTETSAFDLQSTDTAIQGKHALDVSWTVKNTDNETHDAEVTVQLLEADGTPITKNGSAMEATASITVDAGATHSETSAFSKDGLVSDYESTFVTVDQVTS